MWLERNTHPGSVFHHVQQLLRQELYLCARQFSRVHPGCERDEGFLAGIVKVQFVEESRRSGSHKDAVVVSIKTVNSRHQFSSGTSRREMD